MKHFKTLIIVTVAISAMLFSRVTHAQPVIILTDPGQRVDCTGDLQDINITDKQVNTIVEEDYPYLKNLDCIKNGYFTHQRKLGLKLRNMNRNDHSFFVLNGDGKNLNIVAKYDQTGNLIEGTLVQKDIPIPQSILRFIYSDDEFDGWKMTGNEIQVKDFDPYQTEYKVSLSNGNETRVLHFREYGESIALLRR